MNARGYDLELHANGVGTITFVAGLPYRDVIDAVPDGWKVEGPTPIEVSPGMLRLWLLGPVMPAEPIRCPNCQSTADLSVRETYRAYHPARSSADGRTILAGNALAMRCVSEWMDDGDEDFTMHCWSCAHGWPMPAGVTLEFDADPDADQHVDIAKLRVPDAQAEGVAREAERAEAERFARVAPR